MKYRRASTSGAVGGHAGTANVEGVCEFLVTIVIVIPDGRDDRAGPIPCHLPGANPGGLPRPGGRASAGRAPGITRVGHSELESETRFNRINAAL